MGPSGPMLGPGAMSSPSDRTDSATTAEGARAAASREGRAPEPSPRRPGVAGRHDPQRALPHRAAHRRGGNGCGLSGRTHPHAQAPRGEGPAPGDEPAARGGGALRARGHGGGAHRPSQRRGGHRLRQARRRLLLSRPRVRRRAQPSRGHRRGASRARPRHARHPSDRERARPRARAGHRAPRSRSRRT